MATGRRISELLGALTKFAQRTDYSVLFTGQLKKQRETLTFEIPTLRPAASVVEAWKRFRFMLGPVYLSPRRSKRPETCLAQSARLEFPHQPSDLLAAAPFPNLVFFALGHAETGSKSGQRY